MMIFCTNQKNKHVKIKAYNVSRLMTRFTDEPRI